MESPSSTHATLERPFAASDADLALLLRVARGEPKARRTLAQRLVARIRRAAYTLMGPMPEAEEAAAAALTELLRAASTFPTELTLEAWCDRLTARSVVLFARALPGRRVGPAAPFANAQSLEDMLARLAAAEREAFALHHVFGFALRALAELVGQSEFAVREDLEAARAAFAGLVLRGSYAEPPGDLRQFWALYDRARGTGPLLAPLDDATRSQLSALGAWATSVLAALDDAQRFLDRTEPVRATAQDRNVVSRALSALVATSSPGAIARDERRNRSDPPFDRDGSPWIPRLAVAASVFLVLAAFVALYFHTPRIAAPRRAAEVAPRPVTRAAVPPTIEALPKAHTHARAAALRRRDQLLAPLTPVYEGEALRAADAPGCIYMEPSTELCLGVNSELTLTRIARSDRAITLTQGRAVVALDGSATPLTVALGDVELRTSEGMFGFERDGQTIVVRALRGRALVSAFGVAHELVDGVLLLKGAARELERVPLHPEKVRRDQDLYAGHKPAPSRPVESAPALAPSAEPAPAPPDEPTVPDPVE